jgi:hypothetical protein
VFTRTDLPGERQVYRTSGALVAWWAWAAFAVVLLVVLALGHRDHAALVTVFVVIAITGIMYACALRPRIVADGAGITVVNPLRVHEVPWSAVTQVDLVHNVRVHYRGPASTPAGDEPANGTPAGDEPAGGTPAGEKIVHSWAVQSSGRSRTRNELRARRAARRGLAPEAGSARLPDAAQSALAGSAAEFIARQLNERARVQHTAASAAKTASAKTASAADADSGAPDPAPTAAQVRWTWGPIAAMVVPLLILLAVALA